MLLISKAQLKPRNAKFNNTPHDFEIYLDRGSQVVPCPEDPEARLIPHIMFNVSNSLGLCVCWGGGDFGKSLVCVSVHWCVYTQWWWQWWLASGPAFIASPLLPSFAWHKGCLPVATKPQQTAAVDAHQWVCGVHVCA